MALHEDRRHLGIEADSEQDGGEVGGSWTHDVRLRGHRQRVKVDDPVEDVLVVLTVDPVTEGAEEIAEVHGTGRLNTRENAGHSARLPRWGRAAYPERRAVIR